MTEAQKLRKLARTRAWKVRNKESISAFNKAYHAAHKHELKYKTDEPTRLRRQAKAGELRRMATVLNNTMAQKRRQTDIARNRTAKVLAIEAYGGGCVCCGVREPEFMTLDHVYDDGAAHRRTQPFSVGGGPRPITSQKPCSCSA